MNEEAGYTLVETLAALTVVGLAVAGLSAGAQVLQRQQAMIGRDVAQTQAARSAQAALDRVLARGGPYRSQDPARFSGDSRSLKVDCGAPAPCTVDIADDGRASTLVLVADGERRAWTLPAVGRPHFLYAGALEVGEVWPPQSGRRQALRSLSVAEETGTETQTLLKTRLWREQPQVCAFDPVLQDCR